MPQWVSAGLVLYRIRNQRLEVFLGHPGGPFFAYKDAGHWSIPKGEIEPREDMIETAIREVKEEIGIRIDPRAKFIPLGSIRQKGGKIVHAWALERDEVAFDPAKTQTFKMEWPLHSGRFEAYPEIDRAGYFSWPEAIEKIKSTQVPLLERLARELGLSLSRL
jgi:predicted NUDIX family NTP pyrophosphohydrolase